MAAGPSRCRTLRPHVFIAGLALACDPPRLVPIQPEPADASARVDAGSERTCEPARVTVGALTLRTCDDGAVELLNADRVRWRVRPALTLNGTPLEPGDLAQRTWRLSEEGRARLRMSSVQPGRPTLDLDLRLSSAPPDVEARVEMALELESPVGSEPLEWTTATLVVELPDCAPDGCLRVDPAPSPLDELLLGPEGETAFIWFQATRPYRARTHFTPEGARVVVDLLPAPARLVPGLRAALTGVSVTLGEHPERTLGALEDDARLRPVQESAPPLGWRSGASFGAVVNADLLRAQALAFEAAIGRPPHLRADGAWYRLPGDDRPGPGFPEGLEPVAQGSPGTLGLSWRPLVRHIQTTGFPADPACGAACALLDPESPDVRTAIARRAAVLSLAGISALALDELPEFTPPDLYALVRRTLPDSVAIVAPLESGLPSRDAVEAMSLTTYVGAALGADCLAEERADPEARSARCIARLASVPTDVPSPTTPDPDVLLRALAARWHWTRAGVHLDPGAVRIGAPASVGEARLALTLAAIAGGTLLLGDDLRTLSAERWTLVRRLVDSSARLGEAFSPVDLVPWRVDPSTGLAATPRIWRSVDGLFLACVNPGPGSMRCPVPEEADLAGREGLTDVPLTPGTFLDVAPRDAVLLVAPRAVE